MRNISYEINPCENGYILKKSWYEKNGEFTDYKYNSTIFLTWEALSKWVSENALEVPPKQV